MNMNMNLFNHNNNSASDYVQLNSSGCWIVRQLNQHLKLSSRQSEKAEWNNSMKTYKHKAHVMRNWHIIQ